MRLASDCVYMLVTGCDIKDAINGVEIDDHIFFHIFSIELQREKDAAQIKRDRSECPIHNLIHKQRVIAIYLGEKLLDRKCLGQSSLQEDAPSQHRPCVCLSSYCHSSSERRLGSYVSTTSHFRAGRQQVEVSRFPVHLCISAASISPVRN